MSREKKDKREHEYPIQLESQFIIRMPEEPGKVLGELIKSGDNFKNRFTIKINDDLRHGEVRLDHWLLQAKIVDLPTIIESWKSVDRKSIYKTADICQMMICKEKFDEVLEDESLKNKKKDPLKVEKKYLWPHGVTPPTKNVRKRRFRKTLKKKCAEAPEIEKEVKRLLRADNEALSYTWEVVGEEDGNTSKSDLTDSLPTTKPKREPSKIASTSKVMSKEEDIFGGALSDSDAEDESFTIEDRKLSSHVQKPSTKSVKELKSSKPHTARGIKSEMSEYNRKTASTSKSSSSHFNEASVEYGLDDSTSLQETDNSYSISKIQECGIELEELKQRRQRTQVEISRMENMTLRQRFQDILKTLNKEIAIKELEYQKLKANYH